MPSPCWPGNYSFIPARIKNGYTYDRGHCRPGFAGPLCSVCELGYFPDAGTKFCFPCIEGQLDIVSPSLILFSMLFVTIVAIAAYFIWKKMNDEGESDDEDDDEAFETGSDEPTLLDKYGWLIELVERAKQRYLKVILNTSQILSSSETTMSISFPAPFNQGVNALQSTSLSISNIIPMACIAVESQPTFYSSFVTNTFWPLGAFTAMYLDYVVEKWYTDAGFWRNGMTVIDWERKTTEERMNMRKEHITAVYARNFNLFLVLSYLIVPGCSKIALDMMNCTYITSKQTYIQKKIGGEDIEDVDVTNKFISNGQLPLWHRHNTGESLDSLMYGTAPRTYPEYYETDKLTIEDPHSYLTLDMSIDCHEDKYVNFYWPMVMTMVFIYPLGIPLIYYVLLIKDDAKLNPRDMSMEDAIEYRMKDPELAKTQFLWFQYKPKVYYFEVVETFRRIILTAAITMFGSPQWRRAAAIFFALCFYVWYRDVEPYQWDDTNVVSNMCQFQIILTFFICFLLSIPASYNLETDVQPFDWLTYESNGVNSKVSLYVPGLIMINMMCILTTIRIQKHTFLHMWKTERERKIERLRRVGMETDIGSLHKDVESLLVQLSEARDVDKTTPHFDTVHHFDFRHHAFASDAFHDQKNKKKSTHGAKYEHEMVIKKERWLAEIGKTFLPDEPTPLEAEIVSLKAHLKELCKFLILHPGNDNNEGTGETFLAEVDQALDELGRVLRKKNSVRKVTKGLRATVLTAEEIRARKLAQDKLDRLKHFADELHGDREAREMYLLDEKLRLEKEEARRLERVKAEIAHLRKSRSVGFCDKFEPEGDVSFDAPSYPCYVMRLSTLIERGLEIAHFEHTYTHEMLLGKIDWPSPKHPDWADAQKKSRKYFKCKCKAVEERLNANDYDPITEKEPKCNALLHKLIPGGARPLEADTYFISHQWEGQTMPPSKYISSLTPYRRRRPGSASPDNHRRTKLQWVQNLRRHFKLSEKNVFGKEREIWIWWDWLSMPSQSEVYRERAICSLPYYIQHCRNFIPLVRDPHRWSDLYPNDSPPLSGPTGTIHHYLQESSCRLDILLALCPKMFEWKWRSGMCNLRYRYHEDPGFCGVGPLVTMESIVDANPVGDDSIFQCCVEAKHHGLEDIHHCDKPDYYKSIHRVALQYEEYVLDGEEEWDLTAKVATKIITETGIWSGNSIDHRPQWLIDACELSWVEYRQSASVGKEAESEETKQSHDNAKSPLGLEEIYSIPSREAHVTYTSGSNPLYKHNDSAKAEMRVTAQGLSDREKREKHQSGLKAKLQKAKILGPITDLGPPVSLEKDNRNRWHRNNADVSVLEKLSKAQRYQGIREKMIRAKADVVIEGSMALDRNAEVFQEHIEISSPLHMQPDLGVSAEVDETVVEDPSTFPETSSLVESAYDKAAEPALMITLETGSHQLEPIQDDESSVDSDEEDWIEAYDEARGLPYFHNVVTGETTWDIPVELAAARMELATGKTPEMDDADVSESEGSDDDGDWIEAVDKARGIPYYHNIETGETTWEMPSELMAFRAVRAAKLHSGNGSNAL